ncbi:MULTISPECIES: enoyl-CoA hydratase/isomerase family protein [unclassified Oceanobacter]|uniref:enoyl-CoA hydratase/isomerase family protein n=1 Tax=unclassified Oceanobacter TaxID=2620260 RepID=UPI0027326D45|nr:MULTISPECIES: enoyl-CoA hydratase-related protein [unclassified Oceanobacter]MDP2607622.1 enoyl-CoA hydratase-related protein [Oceanobacter sp. 1_MG-2023]MDP2610890.1 enoyl-CoA hydratase-related protein [Oceanobacter sp. 2_MG-2023]
MFEDLLYRQSQGVALLQLNRPQVLNAIRVQTYRDLIASLTLADQDDQVNVIVLSGSATTFSAGNDLSDLLPGGNLLDVKEGVAGIFHTLAALCKPLIIAQEGVAIGIGANLLLHADLAYAGKSTRYSLPFAKIGVTSEGACSVLLAETVGPKIAAELLLSGRFFSAAEAQQWGLLNQVTEDGQAQEQAMAMAHTISKNSQGSIRAIKQLAREEGHVERVDRAVDIEMQRFAELLHTQETQLRIQQVLSKQ